MGMVARDLMEQVLRKGSMLSRHLTGWQNRCGGRWVLETLGYQFFCVTAQATLARTSSVPRAADQPQQRLACAGPLPLRVEPVSLPVHGNHSLLSASVDGTSIQLIDPKRLEHKVDPQRTARGAST